MNRRTDWAMLGSAAECLVRLRSGFHSCEEEAFADFVCRRAKACEDCGPVDSEVDFPGERDHTAFEVFAEGPFVFWRTSVSG